MTDDERTWYFCLSFLSGIVAWLVFTGCQHPLPNLENVEAVAQYESLLEHCRERGKVAGSYAVYEACADAVDRELCNERGLRCRDAGAP